MSLTSAIVIGYFVIGLVAGVVTVTLLTSKHRDPQRYEAEPPSHEERAEESSFFGLIIVLVAIFWLPIVVIGVVILLKCFIDVLVERQYSRQFKSN